MATVNIIIGGVSGGAEGAPAIRQDLCEDITSSGVSQVSTITAPSARKYAQVTVAGGDVYVAVGASPVASAGTCALVLAGQTRDFSMQAGDGVAVIDA